MNFDLTEEPEGYWLDYEDDPEEDPAKRLAFLVIPKTPLIEDRCRQKARTKPVHVNGRFRRQVELPEFNSVAYERQVFIDCCRGWRNLNDPTGQPIPYTEENKAKLSFIHAGSVNFVNDWATALGETTLEQIKQERAKFRGVPEIPSRSPQSEL